MGMTETASRIIAKFGQAGFIERPGDGGGTPWEPEPSEPVLHDATIAVVNYDLSNVGGTLIQAGDLRALVSVEGLDIAPSVSDRLIVGDKDFAIVTAIPIAPDGVPRFYDVQVRN